MNAKHRPDRAQQLAALYAELPTMECRGRCHDSCTSIRMTKLERQLIARRHGVTIPDGSFADCDRPCVALTMLKRCGVYQDRPLICRLWGLTRTMQCSYGCVPDGGWISDQKAFGWLAHAAEISGDQALAAQFRQLADLPNLTSRLQTEVHGALAELARAEEALFRVAGPIPRPGLRQIRRDMDRANRRRTE